MLVKWAPDWNGRAVVYVCLKYQHQLLLQDLQQIDDISVTRHLIEDIDQAFNPLYRNSIRFKTISNQCDWEKIKDRPIIYLSNLFHKKKIK